MRSRRTSGIVGVLAPAAFAWISLAGCDGVENACTDYCTKKSDCCMAQSGCIPDEHDVGTCVTTCQDLAADDEGFRDTIQDQASCYAGSTCDEIASGECVPEP